MKCLFIGGSVDGQWREVDPQQEHVKVAVYRAGDGTYVETYSGHRFITATSQVIAFVAQGCVDPFERLIAGYRAGVHIPGKLEPAMLEVGSMATVCSAQDPRVLYDARIDCMKRTGREPVVSILVTDPTP